MSSTDYRVEKLRQGNYASWKIHLTSILKSRGYWKYIEKQVDISRLGPDDPVHKEIEDVKSLLFSTIEGNQIIAVGMCDTPRDVWTKIQTNHEGAEQDLRSNTLAEFLSFRYKKGEDIIQYCARFEAILNRLQAAGHESDRHTQIWVLRNSLPPELKTIVTNWTTAQPNGTIYQLLTFVKIQYHLDKSEAKNDELAFIGTENRKYGRKNPDDSDRQNDRTIKCTYCKKDGHLWKVCRKLKTDKERRKKPDTDHETKGDHSPKDKHRAFYMRSNKDQQQKNLWIIDSGATAHMTFERKILADYKAYENPVQITMGTGKVTYAYGEGSYLFKSGKYHGKLERALWVPHLTGNLFSLAEAYGHGIDVTFSKDTKTVRFTDNRKTILEGYELNNLFVMELVPERQLPDSEIALSHNHLLHRVFAHLNTRMLNTLIKNDAVSGLDKLVKSYQQDSCQDCMEGKMTRSSHPTRQKLIANEHSAVLHLDLVGPISPTSLGGSRYLLVATEEYSGFIAIKAISSKDEASNQTKLLISNTELISKRPVKLVVSDNGREFQNQDLRKWLESKGICHEFSCVYVPQQNGRAERSNRTIIEGIKTLLTDSGLSSELWAEAASYLVYALNRTLAPNRTDKTRYELIYGTKPDVSNLRAFGQPAMVHKSPVEITKTSPRAKKNLRMVGYGSRFNTYRLFDNENNAIIVSCDVKFLTDKTEKEQSGQKPESHEDSAVTINFNENHKKPTETNQPNEAGSQDSTADVSQISNQENNEPQNDPSLAWDGGYDNLGRYSPRLSISEISDISDISSPEVFNQAQTTRATRSKNEGNFEKDPLIPNWFWTDKGHKSLFTNSDEPLTVREALSGPDGPNWQEAMDAEMAALRKNETWTLTDAKRKTDGTDIKPIKCKWVFKRKSDGRFRARLVAKGYSQIQNIDYKETFAPVASMILVRVLMALVCQLNLKLLQFDIRTAFLYGELKEEIYMTYPEGYPNRENKLCKLKKSIYGLKQAPRCWNTKFDDLLKKFKLTQSRIDRCLYYNLERKLILVIYVDDGLAAAEDESHLRSLIEHLRENFDLNVSECKDFLGLQVEHDHRNSTIFIHQRRYIDQILDRFNMAECKPIATPEEPGVLKIENSEQLGENFPFKELVGSLLYLVTCTRPDLAHAVSIASRTSKPTITHWQLLKRILRYLKGTNTLGILFKREKHTTLVGYSDADYANDPDTRRSNTGFVIIYNGSPIMWRCQRQSVVALSTTEAEYISGSELAKELIPLREMLKELKMINDEPTPVRIDNQSTVKISHNEVGQQKTKHIEVRERWLTEQQSKGNISVEYVPSTKQVADMLTKSLPKVKFISNRSILLHALTLICMLTVTSGLKFTRVEPLFFRPTENTYLSGDTEFDLEVILMNPCERLFVGWSGVQSLDTRLINTCLESYNDLIMKPLNNCASNLTGIPPVNETEIGPLMRTKLARHKRLGKQDLEWQNDQDKHFLMSRKPREATVILLIGTIIVAGAALFTSIQTASNMENIKRMQQDRDNNHELQIKGAAVFDELRKSVHGLTKWSMETEKKLNKALTEGDPIFMGQTASLIHHYETTFEEQSKVLKQLGKELKHNRISPILLELSNETLWEEPAARWSTLYNCTATTKEKDLVIKLHFNMPIKDPTMRIVEAVAIPFYNRTVDDKGKEAICWTVYNGPKQMLLNTTNNCMTDTITWAEKDGTVRSQTCKGVDEEIKNFGDMWIKETCSQEPKLIKKRISDYEINGLHRVYCFPFNITLDNEKANCPDHVFQLEGRQSYTIANFEHIGRYVQRTVMKDSDFHRSKLIASQLKADNVKMIGVNLTSLDQAHESFVRKLSTIPSKLNLITGLPGTAGIFGWMKDIYDSATEWLQIAGYVLTVLAIGICLLLAAPILELLFIGWSILKYPLRIWKKVTTKIARGIKTRIEGRQYWEADNDLRKLV